MPANNAAPTAISDTAAITRPVSAPDAPRRRRNPANAPAQKTANRNATAARTALVSMFDLWAVKKTTTFAGVAFASGVSSPARNAMAVRIANRAPVNGAKRATRGNMFSPLGCMGVVAAAARVSAPPGPILPNPQVPALTVCAPLSSPGGTRAPAHRPMLHRSALAPHRCERRVAARERPEPHALLVLDRPHDGQLSLEVGVAVAQPRPLADHDHDLVPLLDHLLDALGVVVPERPVLGHVGDELVAPAAALREPGDRITRDVPLDLRV